MSILNTTSVVSRLKWIPRKCTQRNVSLYIPLYPIKSFCFRRTFSPSLRSHGPFAALFPLHVRSSLVLILLDLLPSWLLPLVQLRYCRCLARLVYEALVTSPAGPSSFTDLVCLQACCKNINVSSENRNRHHSVVSVAFCTTRSVVILCEL